jgi:hypothetical protein
MNYAHYPAPLSVQVCENYITKLLPYDKVIIKDYAVKRVEKCYYRGVSGSSLKKIVCYFSGFCDVCGNCLLFKICNLL